MAPSPRMTMTNTPHHAGALVLLATLALTASAVAPAQAAALPRSAKPSFALSAAGGGGALLLRGTRGRVLHGAVLVHNVSRHRITVRLQPSDVGNATNGNADYIVAGRKLAGRWLRLSATTVRLAPKSSRRIVFALRVPMNVRGASHYAGIVAVDAAETVAAKAPRRSSKGTGFSFSRINRQALPITIRLPGPLTRRLTLR